MKADTPSAPPAADSARRAARAEWLRLIAQGGRAQDAALRQLTDAYDSDVIGFCIWRMRLSRAEAEDVWQDVLIRICEHAATFRPGTDPASWIWAMVRNRATDVLRDAWRKNRIDHGGDGPPEVALPPSQGRPSQFIADDCVHRGLQDFARTHPDEALAISLRDLEDWPIPKLAAFLGRTDTATRSFLASLRKKLRPFLAPCLGLLVTEN